MLLLTSLLLLVNCLKRIAGCPKKRFLGRNMMLIVFIALLFGCNAQQSATDFLKEYDEKSKMMEFNYAEASFIKATNITDYNTKKAEAAYLEYSLLMKEFRKNASKIDYKNAGVDLKRQFEMLLTNMEPNDTKIVMNISAISGEMENIYSTATIPYNKSFIKTITPDTNRLSLDKHLKKIIAESRDSEELLYVWEEWRKSVGPPLRDLYTEFVKLNNIGAKDNGYKDAGDYKRKVYEIDSLEEVVESFWEELKPFYQEVHAYVRYKLATRYPKIVKDGEPIPAHLLGDMWAQSWANVFELATPYPGKYIHKVL